MERLFCLLHCRDSKDLENCLAYMNQLAIFNECISKFKKYELSNEIQSIKNSIPAS